MSQHNRKPRAIRIEQEQGTANPVSEAGATAAKARKPRSIEDVSRLEILPDTAVNGAIEALDPPLPPPARRRFSWGGLFLAGLGGLVSLAAGLAVDQLIRDLFDRNNWLGWAAAALAGIVVLAALAIAIREIGGMMRLRSIHLLREKALSAWSQDDGKAAHSIVTLRRRWASVSELGVELKTGRTHQIRVHLTHCGYPLVGDEKYGDFALNKQLARQMDLSRMFLHAARLRFAHPLTGAQIEVEAALPAALQNYLARVDAAEERDFGPAL